MYTEVEAFRYRQRDLQRLAMQERRASQLLKLQRASRRADRAEESMMRALNDVMRMRGKLNIGL